MGMDSIDGSPSPLIMRIMDTFSLRTLSWSEKIEPSYTLLGKYATNFTYAALAADSTMIAVITSNYVDFFDFAI
jgi:hypothetical protein